jgi:hypothetical protein
MPTSRRRTSPAALKTCSDVMVHVHISENDRSTPGQGQVHWQETFDTLKKIRYDGWLTIEAFGLALPSLAAATKIWRKMFVSEEQLATDGLRFMKREWAKRSGGATTRIVKGPAAKGARPMVKPVAKAAAMPSRAAATKRASAGKGRKR